MASSYDALKTQTNLIIASIGDYELNPATKLIRDLLGKKAFDNTLENTPVVLARDQFANNQLFMIMSGYKESDIRQYLEKNGSSIKNEFDNNFDQKQSQYFLESKRQEDLENQLLSDYGWSINLPWGWEMIRNNPVINKVDLPNADIENVTNQIIELTSCNEEDILLASAKTGEGIQTIIDTIIEKIPPPDPPKDDAFKALIFDSKYDRYRGVVAYIRVYEGSISRGSKIKFFSHNTYYDVDEVGHFVIDRKKSESLKTGEVGYIIANVRDIEHVLPGDTVTNVNKPCKNALPGFQKIKPMVFSGLFPADAAEYDDLRTALEKLKLNDASLSFEPEVSDALGFGYRCGFLGLLHMEIIQERLEREFNLS